MALLGSGSIVSELVGVAAAGASRPSIGSTRKRGLSSLETAEAGEGGDAVEGASATTAALAAVTIAGAAGAATALALLVGGVMARLGARGFFSGAARATAAVDAAGKALT